FEEAVRQEAVDRFCAAGTEQEVDAVGRAFPNQPEGQGNGKIDRNAAPGIPTSAGKRPQTAAAVMHTRPAIVKESPVKRDGKEVDLDGDAMSGELAAGRSTRAGVLRIETSGNDAGSDQQKADEMAHGRDRFQRFGHPCTFRSDHLIVSHVAFPFRLEKASAYSPRYGAM